VIASESTALRKALRVAQIEEHTATDEAYQSFLESQNQGESELQLPDRETYREQARAQVDWMLSGGVTLVLALLTYLFASVLLALVATVLLHHIWGLPSLS
jgi:Flp pilus assembly protein TadB